ncbi:ABC transporter ATP-binding protein [Methanococcoides burtonii]|uniref:ABC transporter, ATPase subunit n=1 Tax=Methanococcoides burtonii (strain DSM 6242 / NBRC 107633 / OCM 468 / ACE-M) TaxID=259564 RepID=Q12V06_METBU|nr:ABC transporter ATP-binding protein [Methanococcoides burtonii]ABE52720.1 ABC transporter, ATPase subunit [Methanococcoides burtonii DSM 6242]
MENSQDISGVSKTGNENILEIRNLTKQFGKQGEIVAVDSLSLDVKKGEVFGFVGPNGAGKTTTMKMLIGLLEPTSGTGKVAGFDIVREIINIREVTGVLPEPAGFYDNLTARQNLRFYAKLYNIETGTREKRIVELLEMVGLNGAIDQKIGGFSTGMLKRFGLAQALINEPGILFLDEPTSGIDPKGAQMMRDLIKKLSRENDVTIFLSSHSMSEVEEICNRIAVIEKGKLLAVGTVEELQDMVREKEGVQYILEISDFPLQYAADKLNEIDGVFETRIRDGVLHVHADAGMRAEIAKSIKLMDGTVSRFEEDRMDLQKVFLKLIGS